MYPVVTTVFNIVTFSYQAKNLSWCHCRPPPSNSPLQIDLVPVGNTAFLRDLETRELHAVAVDLSAVC